LQIQKFFAKTNDLIGYFLSDAITHIPWQTEGGGKFGECLIFALWRSLLFAVFMLYGLFCLLICISVRNVYINIIMLCIVKY
jgi:hypothetical protein